MVSLFGAAIPFLGPVLEFAREVFFDEDDDAGQLAAQIATVATGVPVPIQVAAPAPAPLPQDPFSQQARGRCPSGAVPLVPGLLSRESCPNPDFFQFLPAQTAFISVDQDEDQDFLPFGFPALSRRAAQQIFPGQAQLEAPMVMQDALARPTAAAGPFAGFAPKDAALASMLSAANNNWTDGQIRAIARKARFTLADLRTAVLNPQVMFFIWNAINMASQAPGAHEMRLGLMNQVNNALEGLKKRRRRGMSLKTLQRAGREAKRVARALKDLLPAEVVKRAKIKRRKC